MKPKRIFGAFKEAYPFVEVKQTMMAGAVGFERLRAEFASGRRTTDLINTSTHRSGKSRDAPSLAGLV